MNTSFLSPRLSIRLLGEWRLTLDGAPLKGKLYGKVVALLAYLATESDRSHTREHLATLFWPALPAEAARPNLRQALHYLRQAFGPSAPDIPVASRDTVRLSGSHPDFRGHGDPLPVPVPPLAPLTR